MAAIALPPPDMTLPAPAPLTQAERHAEALKLQEEVLAFRNAPAPADAPAPAAAMETATDTAAAAPAEKELNAFGEVATDADKAKKKVPSRNPPRYALLSLAHRPHEPHAAVCPGRAAARSRRSPNARLRPPQSTLGIVSPFPFPVILEAHERLGFDPARISLSRTPAATVTGTRTQGVVGMIYPPPEIRNIVDKTAGFVAKNGGVLSFSSALAPPSAGRPGVCAPARPRDRVLLRWGPRARTVRFFGWLPRGGARKPGVRALPQARSPSICLHTRRAPQVWNSPPVSRSQRKGRSVRLGGAPSDPFTALPPRTTAPRGWTAVRSGVFRPADCCDQLATLGEIQLLETRGPVQRVLHVQSGAPARGQRRQVEQLCVCGAGRLSCPVLLAGLRRPTGAS